ncbi:MAG: hypothetical protein KGJ86_21100, partial [Chloroflexota bacterium]|nr:hypothetical protein [Chloroflexota bacterium]
MNAAPPPDPARFDRRYQKRIRRHRRSVFWPLILIAVGSIFLLQNFGLLSWDIWSQLWRLWPLLLVVVGIELIFRDALPGAFGSVVAVVLIVAVLAVAVGFSGSLAPAAPSASSATSQALNGARRASVRIDFGAGQLKVGALDQPGDLLSSVT